MRLEEYWGVGPKTGRQLESELGVERAIEAIESADVRALTGAGIGSGRATRICRRATAGEAMDALATSDARSVYRELIALIRAHAVTREAADRIRVLTPMESQTDMIDRLEWIESVRDAWNDHPEATHEAVYAAFDEHDEAGGGTLAAVETALDLRDVGLTNGSFSVVGDLDPDRLREAAAALEHLDDGDVRPGADETLDRRRETHERVESLAGSALDVLSTIRSDEVRDTDQFREAFVDHVVAETGVGADRVRDAMPGDATDAADFVNEALRVLASDCREAVEEREATVAEELTDAVEDAQEAIDAAEDAVSDIAFGLSLVRFAEAYDLSWPTFVDDRDCVAVVNARNLSLAAAGDDVQPVTYAVGDHDLNDGDWMAAPSGDVATVLTGANSGGKTTLLETLCQVVLLASMGLPVPAERAAVSPVDSIVFHRRHASFNAGVLESTLRTIVPPLSSGDHTLMLVDEFEAITEPGSAADLLHGLVTLTVDREAMGVFVTHLAEDLEPLPDAARVDGIFAEGLNPDLELEVDYQPRFEAIGKSTPEFIVSRLVAEANDGVERAGFETLARAIGEEAVQRTLADARWAE